jgi:CheY-like chemotaxis protein
MPEDVIAQAFDPFFTTKPVGEGTGLGLSMVYGFVKQSGGHVRIDSKVGQGTSVKLYLPRAVQVAELPALKVDAKQGEEQTVLVVDDNETLRAIMIEVVEELGYRYLEAPDARTAIPMLESSSQPINLLITDVGLPFIDGRQLAQIARLHRPDLKVLFVTGFAANAAVRGEFLAPGMEMLNKPFTLDVLGDKLEALLKS